MSILNATDWDAIDLTRPVLAKGVKRVTLGEIREETDSTKDGTARMSLLVPLVLAEAAVDLDGKPVAAGFVFTDRISVLVGPTASGGDLTDGQKKSAEINLRRQKQLVLAALGLPKDALQIGKTLTDMGGWAALTGRAVMASIDTRPDRNDESVIYQDVKSYSAAK